MEYIRRIVDDVIDKYNWSKGVWENKDSERALQNGYRISR